MRNHRLPRVVLLFTALLLSSLSRSALALIKINDSVGKTFAISKSVWLGKVVSVDASKRLAVVKGAESYKGDPVPENFNIVIGAPAELIDKLRGDAPVVLFVSKGNGPAALHLADTWTIAAAAPGVTPPVWKVGGLLETANKSFPGRTIAMARLLAEIKAGKSTLLTEAENTPFRAPWKQRATLPVKEPTSLLAIDVNADRQPDLLIGTRDGIKLFLAGASGYTDATQLWGLESARGEAHAAGSIRADGRIDLLLGNEIYLNDGKKFVPAGAKLALPPDVRVLACALQQDPGGKASAMYLLSDGKLLTWMAPAGGNGPWSAQAPRTLFKANGDEVLFASIGDFGDDGQPHAMVVRPTGVTRYPIASPGELPADYARLCGQLLAYSSQAMSDHLKEASCVTLDINGDHRPDLLLASSSAAVLMVNRGFGTFLPLPNPADVLLAGNDQPHAPASFDHQNRLAGADLQGAGQESLLLLTPNGTLWEADNLPPVGH